MTEDELNTRLTVLERQQAYLTNALAAALQGQWAGGADTAEAWVYAINPTLQGTLKLDLPVVPG